VPTQPPRSLRIVQSHVQLDDPHLCSDDSNSLALQGAIYEALAARVDTATCESALATEWRVEDDARTWTFTLRPGVSAYDGESVGADDVIATLERVRDPSLGGVLGTEGVFASYLEGATVEAGTTPDGRETVRVVLARPLADLLDLIVDFPVVPRRAQGRHADAPVGTGRYRFVRGDEHEVVLRRWERHWGATDGYDEVVFAAERDPEARAAAVRRGHADVASGLTPALPASLDGAEGVRVVQRPASMCAVFFFNLHPETHGSPVHDARVRRALHHATDVDAIVASALRGRARRLSGPFTELHLAHDPAVPPYPLDRERASALLAEAGYADGCDLTVNVPTRHPDEAQQVAAMLREQWAAVSVRLHVVAHDDRPGYAHMVRANRIHDLCCFDSGPISSYRVLVEKFQSTVRGPWWQGYANIEVDALIERAAATTDTDACPAVYRDANRLLAHDAPWLYLYSPDTLWLTSERVDDWAPTFQGISAL